jgi:hypothetical protein
MPNDAYAGPEGSTRPSSASVSDLELFKAFGFFGLVLDTGDVCPSRSGLTPFHKFLDRIVGSLGNDFHGAIREVADPTGDTEFLSLDTG